MRCAFFAVLGFFLVSVKPAAAELPTRPNIVLMMADDQGWGEVGYHGHPHVKTPVLDSMAAAGLRLDRFYSGGCVCSPTRTSVMTGRNPTRSGVFAPNYTTRPEEITIAHALRDAGYRTGHFGKWHIGAVKADSPTNPAKMGFDEYLSHDNFFELNPPLSRDGATPQIHTGESSAIVADAAADFVRRAHADGEAFFVVLWFGSPHGPHRGLAEDVALYAGALKEDMRHRFAEITAMDRAIGEFRQCLAELGVARDTLVWYTSDNGIPVGDERDSFNGGWRGKKGTIYEGGLRVPTIIEWPAVITAPRRSETPCVSSDIMPTLLDITGIPHPDPDRPLDGISLAGLVAGEPFESRPSAIGFWKYDAAGERRNERWMPIELTRGTTPTTRNAAIDFLNFRHPAPRTSDFGGQAAWTDNQYKLVISRAGRKGETTVELFDLLADPKETTNLANQEGEVVKRMTNELRAWQASVERSLSGADYAP